MKKLSQDSARHASQRRSSLTRFLTSASVIALGAFAACSPAWGQDAATEDEVIVVRGIRASLNSAQEIKRNSDVIVDSITAVDIGALPDRSVAEALQRIPGITLQRTNETRDPLRLSSEGGGVFVRGLSFVRSETNGRDVFSAQNGRGLSFEDISSDLLAGVDVYKNASADLIEGGIGGTVNLRTRLPFDAAGQVAAFSTDYTYGDLIEEGFATYNGFYSNRWNTGGDSEIGLLVSYSHADVGNRTDIVAVGGGGGPQRRTLGAAVDGLSIGADVFIPGGGPGWRTIEWRQERESLYGALQVSPTSDLTFTFQALYASSLPVDYERAIGNEFGYNADAAGNNYEMIDGQHVLVGGTIDSPGMGLNNRKGQGNRHTGDFSMGFDYQTTGQWSFSGDLQYIESSAGFVSMSVGTATDVSSPDRPDLIFDLTGDDPQLSFVDPTNFLADQENYTWAWGMDHVQDNEANSWAGRLDAEYAFADDSFFRSFKFGVRGTDREAITRQTGYNWNLLSSASWGSDGRPAVHLDETGFDTDATWTSRGRNADLPNQSEAHTFSDFFHGDVPNPGVGWFPIEDLVQSPDHAWQFLQNTYPSNTWGWAPLSIPDAFSNLNPQGDNVSAGINRQLEETQAAYALLRFGSDAGIGGLPFDGNIGVRVVQTTATSFGRVNVGGLPAAAANCTTSPECQSARAFAAAVPSDYVAFSNEYTNTLPSVNVRFHLNDEMQLRLSASQSMVRPNFSQMNGFTSLAFDFRLNGGGVPVLNSLANFPPGSMPDGNPTPLSGFGGNPGLEPTVSDNLDASFEWYFNSGGSFSVALFHKDIENYVVVAPDAASYTFGGETIDFVVNRQINSSEGTLQGFEVAYQQFFDFLPGALSGFGVQANYTYIDNEGGANNAVNPFDPNQVTNAAGDALPLEGISPTSYNLTAMYEKYGISARLAYNWRERYLVTTSAANLNVPVWWEDYGQLDGSIFYNITDAVKIGLQAQNLLGARTYLDISSNDPNVSQTAFTPRHQWSDTDTRYTVSLRAQF